MNEQEIEYNLLEVEKGNRRNGLYLKGYIIELKEERNKLYEALQEQELKITILNKTINKAVEYIRNNSYKFLYYEETDEGQIDLSKCKYRITPLRATKVKQLLDILKGSDTNE